jgi:hypothetical protein
MHKTTLVGLRLAVLSFIAGCIILNGCAATTVSVRRMKTAPPRPHDCELKLVEADMMELSPMGTKWDVLGFVSVGANDGLDPTSKEIRTMVRPKACEIGGTAVALMQSMNSTSSMGSSGAIQFAVIRPKSASKAPSRF